MFQSKQKHLLVVQNQIVSSVFRGQLKKVSLLFVGLFLFGINMIAQTTTIGDFEYTFSGSNAIVKKYNGGGGVCSVPSKIYYNGLEYNVTKIGNRAFEYATVTEIQLPETIEYIGESSFTMCKSMIKINLPNGLKEIAARAFWGCYNLTQLIIPASVNFAQDSAFPRHYFQDCLTLRTLIYLGTTAPQRWTASGNTYVPDPSAYSSPYVTMNDATIIEMITFNENTFNYTGKAPMPTWTNNVAGWTANLDLSVIKADAGSYTTYIPANFTNGTESFSTQIKYTYTINKSIITATVADASRVYGDSNPEFNISYSGFLNGEDEGVITTKPTASTSATPTSNVGTYPITVSGGVAQNYTLRYETGTLTITKAGLKATVKDATKVYGENNPSFTISYYGLKNNEKAPAWTSQPVFQTEATRLSGVGQYVINAVNAVPVNYNLEAITSGTLTITPAALTIRANAASRKYYAENPTFNYTCSGFVNGDTQSSLSVAPSLTTTAKLSSKVGEYEIKVSGAESKNYSISYVNGTLTITPCTLRASVGNYERVYNEENPTFEVKYDGFVGNEDESVLSVKPLASTTATKTSNVGTYTIYVSGGSADNYTFTYSSGYLTINKAEQTIEWNQDLSNLKVGDQVELTASVSSGLPVSYTLLQANGAAEIYNVVNKSYLDCIKPGEFSMRAVNNGNTNYYASPRSSKTVSIKSSTGIREVNGEAKNGVSTYDTMGRKVRKLKKGQLYIRQGKKFVIK